MLYWYSFRSSGPGGCIWVEWRVGCNTEGDAGFASVEASKSSSGRRVELYTPHRKWKVKWTDWNWERQNTHKEMVWGKKLLTNFSNLQNSIRNPFLICLSGYCKEHWVFKENYRCYSDQKTNHGITELQDKQTFFK